MRILHLFANYKWTGPADPAIRCAAWLRRIGCDVVFAQADWTLPNAEHRMAKELRRAHMPVVAGLALRKHFGATALLRDAKRLRERLDRGDFDVLHAHLLADHMIAALAKRRAAHRPIVVRSLYDPEPPSRLSWRDRLALRYTDGVVVPTRSTEVEMRRRFGLASDRLLYQDPPIDTVRRKLEGHLRREWQVGDEEFLVGITARIQPHRRFDLLWQTLRLVVDRRPATRLVLLGRGNAEDTERLVREPIARLGLQKHVVLPGYLYEPEYGLALRSLDAFLFLVPGSDGTCRAVREAMALGLPVLATPRGILPELVEGGGDHGPAGAIAREDPRQLAAKLIAWHDDPDTRVALGRYAARRVDESMDPERAARRLLAFYERLRAPR